MATPERRRHANAAGEFYVDSTCIDCGTCRWMAPRSFDRAGAASRVHRQPETAAEARAAEKALLACPVDAIGTATPRDLSAARDAFPDPIEIPESPGPGDSGVYHCGYHARSSFGAASYLIRREAGNILVDSPRFARPLVERIEALGGVRLMFLTHRDDVADHRKFRDHFGCDRLIHRADLGPETEDIERPLDGDASIALDDDLRVIPVPGHTEGSACLLYRDTHLFSGDHVAWNEEAERVRAFRHVCWYDWRVQTESMARLAEYRFEWILPGHGWRCHFSAARMAEQMRDCIEWMKRN